MSMPQLTSITREMINVSRFGAKVERLTRRKKDKEIPYGPYQVRFCDGARISFTEEDVQICNVIQETQKAIKGLCQRRIDILKGEMQNILHSALNGLEIWESQSATTIEEIDRLATWIDELKDPDQIASQSKDDKIYGLNPAWCYYVDREEDVELAMTEIRNCMMPLRRFLFCELKDKLKAALQEIPSYA